MLILILSTFGHGLLACLGKRTESAPQYGVCAQARGTLPQHVAAAVVSLLPRPFHRGPLRPVSGSRGVNALKAARGARGSPRQPAAAPY